MRSMLRTTPLLVMGGIVAVAKACNLALENILFVKGLHGIRSVLAFVHGAKGNINSIQRSIIEFANLVVEESN